VNRSYKNFGKMMRMGNPSPADIDEEKRAANAAVVGTTLTYFIVCATIHMSPYILEQFGITVTK